MKIFRKTKQISTYLKSEKDAGSKIGFVPTMGALHQGHISLIEQSERENDITVCSIFVNPTQFNNKQDLEKYPRIVEKDIDMLLKVNCDVLFLPEVVEMYPEYEIREKYDLGNLENILEGKFRPGHFQGVALVLHKFLGPLLPHVLYLGQKDYQQIMVVQKLIDLKGYQTKINISPTRREKNGLAMSSRNMRLSSDEKEKAAFIYKSLQHIKINLKTGDLKKVIEEANLMLVENGFTTDYLSVHKAANLEEVMVWDGKEKLVALVASYLGGVRLIDNLLLN